MKTPTLMLLASLACAAVLTCFACASAPSAPLAIEGSADTAEQVACSKSATTREQNEACVQNVRIKYAALIAYDGGADSGDASK